MAVKAGDECRNTGDLRCQRCGDLIHVEEGVSIPTCPGCGHNSFSLRRRPPVGTRATRAEHGRS